MIQLRTRLLRLHSSLGFSSAQKSPAQRAGEATRCSLQAANRLRRAAMSLSHGNMMVLYGFHFSVLVQRLEMHSNISTPVIIQLWSSFHRRVCSRFLCAAHIYLIAHINTHRHVSQRTSILTVVHFLTQSRIKCSTASLRFCRV